MSDAQPTVATTVPADELVQGIVAALVSAGARLTGSRARGDEHAGSDYDFYVSEKAWKRFRQAAPAGWESCVVGHVGWYTREGLIEASYIFRDQRRKRLQEARALGRVWRTW